MVKMVSFMLYVFYHNLKKVSQIVNVIPKDEFKKYYKQWQFCGNK